LGGALGLLGLFLGAHPLKSELLTLLARFRPQL